MYISVTTSRCQFECSSCEIDWPAGIQIYTVDTSFDESRIAWGESRTQSKVGIYDVLVWFV